MCVSLRSLIGLGRSQLADLSVAEAAAPILARLLRQASFEELRYLHCLGVLSAHFLEVLSADGGGESTGEEELWRGTLDLLQSLEGLQRHLSSRSSAVSSSNPHPLLDFMHDLDSGVPLVEPSTQRGLLARITRECLFLHSIDPQACALQHVATYIESPLKQMARAGLGLLSKGLGLFGGTPTASNNQLPHPAEQSVIVLCVVGGISSNEAVQVRQVLAQFNGTYGPAKQVILLSNALLSSDEALSRVFAATAASSTLSASAKESY